MDGRPELGLPGLGGIFETGPVDVVHGLPLPNDALLAAVLQLAVVRPKGQPKRTVDYRNLGAEELGSIYESLLELEPRHDAVEHTFSLETLAGNERKTSGTYFTPGALIDLVLDEALDPVLNDAEKSAATLEEAEAALLGVTVCDPACGSGHFLVAAARRIAHRVAVARTGYVDPTPADLQAAVHDVVARCLYGIDLKPLAAELAKVSLWLEALQPGRPLTFLDAHIKVGNALLGTTPALLAAGLPDSAFKPIEGDDKKWAAALRKRNAAERDAALAAHQQGDLFESQGLNVSNAELRRRIREATAVTAAPTASLADVHLATQRLRAIQDAPEVRRAFDVANTWCAAFVAPKTDAAVGQAPPALAWISFLAEGVGEMAPSYTTVVRIGEGSLWVGSDAYPLRNISHVGQRVLVVDKGAAWKRFFLRTLAALFCGLFFGGILENLIGTFWVVLLVAVLGLLIWRLVAALSMPPVYGLIVNTAGTQRDTIWSKAKHEIDHLVQEIAKAISHPDAAQMIFNVQHAVSGDHIQQYGSGSIGKATHHGSGNIGTGR